MKRLALVMFILCGCAFTPPAKVATAPTAAPDCKCTKSERCPDLEAEMDRGTPGCTSPEALERLQRREIRLRHGRQLSQPGGHILASDCPKVRS